MCENNVVKPITGQPGSDKSSSRRGTFTITGPIKMDTNPTTSSIFPPPPSQEELRRLWSYNSQYRFNSNRFPFSRPDRHPRQDSNNNRDINFRQVPIHRPVLNLRPPNLRRAPYPAPFPRQPQPQQQQPPVLNFPPPSGWTWVPSQNPSSQSHRFQRDLNPIDVTIRDVTIQTTDRCQLCRRNLPPPPPPTTTRTIGTSTTLDAAEQQEEIWDEIGRNLDDLFRRRAEEEGDPSYLLELEGMSEEIALIREEQREALRSAGSSTDRSSTSPRRR